MGRYYLPNIIPNSAGDVSKCVCIEYKQGECPCSKTINQATSKIIKLVVGKIEKLKKESNIRTYAYMQALDDVIKELGG